MLDREFKSIIVKKGKEFITYCFRGVFGSGFETMRDLKHSKKQAIERHGTVSLRGALIVGDIIKRMLQILSKERPTCYKK